MKYIWIYGIVIGSMIFAIGCGKKTSKITVPGGSVEVTEDGKDQVEAKITTKEGTVEYSMNQKVDLSSLGIPIYPGLSTEEGGSFSASGGKDNQKMQMVNLASSDSQEKVAAFYKEKFKDKKPDIMDMTSNGKQMTHIVIKEENQVMTMVISSDDDGKTRVVFSKNSK